MHTTLTTAALLLTLVAGGDDEKSGGKKGKKGHAAAKAVKVIVKCKADAELRGTDILLRDLAEVDTADPALATRLLEVPFGPRPARGYTRVFTKQDIMLRLAREGLRTANLQMTGARQVVLHPLVTRIRPDELIEAAEPVLRAALELERGDIEFAPASKVPTIVAPPGRYSLDLRPVLAGGNLSFSSAIINVSVLVDGEEHKLVRIPYRLRRYHKVLVTSRAIRRRAEIGEHNVELRRVETSQGTSPYLVSFDDLRGKVASRNLQAGQRLTVGSVRDPAVVFKGDHVSLVAVRGRVQVATRAMVLLDGAVGDRVPVRNLTSNRILQAEVRGRGLVVVHPGRNVTRIQR